MRLAILALSAAVVTGCSGLGAGGHYGAGGNDCLPGAAGYGFQQAGYQQAGYGYAGGANCAGAGYGAGYGAGMGGYGAGAGAGAYGAGGYGAGAGYGQAYGAGAGYGAGGYGAGGYGPGAGGFGPGAGGAGGFGPGAVGAGLAANGFGAGPAAGVYGANGFQATTLGASAPFGAAVGGAGGLNGIYGQNVVGTQYSNGQFVAGQGVQTVVGAPVYVPQPYAAPYGVPQLRGPSVIGAAMPFGFEADAGTEFDIDGDLVGAKAASPNNPDYALATAEVNQNAISYDDAFGTMKTVGGTFGYDVSRNTTLLGGVSYGTASGQTVETGTFEPGSYDSSGNFTSAGAAEAVTAEFSDLDLFTVEGGVRQYVGYNPGFRPYVGATAGFTHNNSVDVTQSSANGALPAFTQELIQSGWNPTAAAVVGAEMAVGPRAAIGVESGVRWRDSMDTLNASDDRISIPLKLRGRLAF